MLYMHMHINMPCAAVQIHQISIAGIYQLLYNNLGLNWATVGGSSIDSYYSRQTTLANQQLYNSSNRSATSYWQAVQYAQNDSTYVLYYDGLMNSYQAYNSCSAILDAKTTIGTPTPTSTSRITAQSFCFTYSNLYIMSEYRLSEHMCNLFVCFNTYFCFVESNICLELSTRLTNDLLRQLVYS